MTFDLLLGKILQLVKSFGLYPFKKEYFFLLFASTLFVMLLEFFFVGWHHSSLKKLVRFDKSTRTDIFAWLIEAFNLFSIISLILSFGLCYYLAGLIQKNCVLNFYVINPYLQFGLIFLVSDFKNFVRHYFFHRSKSLWQLHSFHHSATNFNVLTRQRGHFLESEISRFFDVLPLVFFGAPVYSYFILRVIIEIHQMLLHASFTSNWGIIGKYILVSPASHRLHHSVNEIHYNKNFGSTFIFWDKLFGTYFTTQDNIEIGIPNNPFNKKGYMYDVLLSQSLFFKSIIKYVKRL